ncbi:MAG: heme exporter protein CcmD [Hyphomonadaceae bacterium]
MSANLADPHWAYIWPAYALTMACFIALAWRAFARLRAAKRAAEKGE